jgi:hypothetical protein
MAERQRALEAVLVSRGELAQTHQHLRFVRIIWLMAGKLVEKKLSLHL